MIFKLIFSHQNVHLWATFSFGSCFSPFWWLCLSGFFLICEAFDEHLKQIPWCANDAFKCTYYQRSRMMIHHCHYLWGITICTCNQTKTSFIKKIFLVCLKILGIISSDWWCLLAFTWVIWGMDDFEIVKGFTRIMLILMLDFKQSFGKRPDDC